jgi:hypothetical protein
MEYEAGADDGLLFTVPYFSGPDLLSVLLSSMLDQTSAAWRCVVVDDSADPIAGVELDRIVAALCDERFTVVHNERTLGIAGNFERCTELARCAGAELFAIVHADDELCPDYVAVVVGAHRRHPGSVCVAPAAAVIGEDGSPRWTLADAVKRRLWPRRLERLEGDVGLARLLLGQFFWCPAVSYRTALLPQPTWDDRWSQVMDLDLYGRLLLAGGRIELERRRVYRYRRHPGTATEANSVSMLRTREESRVCDELAVAAAQRGWTRAAKVGRLRPTVRAQALLRRTGRRPDLVTSDR